MSERVTRKRYYIDQTILKQMREAYPVLKKLTDGEAYKTGVLMLLNDRAAGTFTIPSVDFVPTSQEQGNNTIAIDYEEFRGMDL